MSEHLKLAESLLREARNEGAKAAEVLVVASTSRRAERVRGPVRVDEHVEAVIRVFDGEGRRAQARGKVAESTGADAVMRRAFRALERAEPDPYEGPAQRLDRTDRGLSILDRRQAHLDDESRLEVLQDNIEQCTAVGSKIRAGSFTYEEELLERAFTSSRGVHAHEVSTRYRLEGEAFAVGAPDVVIRDRIDSRHFADVASRPLGHELGQRVLALDTRAEPPEGKTAVVFEPRAFAALLEVLIPAFRAERVDTKRSLLLGRTGTRIGSDKLHLVDDGRLPGGYATRAFDDRGVPPVAMGLITEGIADGLYEGVRRAAEHGRRPTGHELEDGGLWMGNLIIRPGSRSRNMLFPDLGTFVAVDEVLDVSDVSERSGKIDVPVRLSRWEGADWAGTIGEAVLDTDIFELFGGIQNLTSDQSRHGRVDACTVITEGPWFRWS